MTYAAVHITSEDVASAIRGATTGPVGEGALGAGTGTVAFGFKGGIGTSSRRLPADLGRIHRGCSGPDQLWRCPDDQRRAGRRRTGSVLPQESDRGKPGAVPRTTPMGRSSSSFGTDAPIENRNLKRLAARAMLGLGRTGSASTNGSGRLHHRVFNGPSTRRVALQTTGCPPCSSQSSRPPKKPSTTLCSKPPRQPATGRTVEALPIDRTLEILRKYNALR